MSQLQQDFMWCKAEKPYPKKHRVSSKPQNPFSLSSKEANSFQFDESSRISDNSGVNNGNIQEEPISIQKIGMKDLCVEDKQRIANLIKELAR